MGSPNRYDSVNTTLLLNGL